MEIISTTCDGRHTLRLNGRLDANWAEHVGNAIEAAIRAGFHFIDIDMGLVDYISSRGIGVLVKHHNQLRSVSGQLRVIKPHEHVLCALTVVNLADMLVQAEGAPPATFLQPEARRWDRGGFVFELHEHPTGDAMHGDLHGAPEKLASGQFAAADCCKIRFDADVIGLGLGAFGSSSLDSSKRVGEFLAAGGAAITQPTDGSRVPDFHIIDGRYVPEMFVLYGLTARGRFSRLLRFEAAGGDCLSITLAELVEVALANLPASMAGIVIAAEASRLVGAMLRQSPAHVNGQCPWHFPAVRDWLSFTTEPTDERHVVLIVGFAERERSTRTAAFLHQIGPESRAVGHFHAAVFPYRPLPKGRIDLQMTISNLLETHTAQTVMHLVADDRDIDGVGQTELMRGACWVGEIDL
jgi:anti-anti-sigma factor